MPGHTVKVRAADSLSEISQTLFWESEYTIRRPVPESSGTLYVLGLVAEGWGFALGLGSALAVFFAGMFREACTDKKEIAARAAASKTTIQTPEDILRVDTRLLPLCHALPFTGQRSRSSAYRSPRTSVQSRDARFVVACQVSGIADPVRP